MMPTLCACPGAIARGRDRRHRARAQRRDRATVDQRQRLAALGAADDDRAVARPAGRSLSCRERSDPLDDRQAVAAGGHGTEVAARRRVEIHLRRHHPIAAGEALEALCHAVDRVLGRDRGEHRVVVDQADRRHARPGYQMASSSTEPTPSCSAARNQPLTTETSSAGGAVVSARNRSIAAITAAASSGDGSGERLYEPLSRHLGDQATSHPLGRGGAASFAYEKKARTSARSTLS